MTSTKLNNSQNPSITRAIASQNQATRGAASQNQATPYKKQNNQATPQKMQQKAPFQLSKKINLFKKKKKDQPAPKVVTLDSLKVTVKQLNILVYFLICFYLLLIGYLIYYITSTHNKYVQGQATVEKSFDEIMTAVGILQTREAQLTAAMNAYLATPSNDSS